MWGITIKRIILTLVLSFLSFGANAALVDRGGGLIYDDVLDITWLQDANYAQTSGYDADGLMNWPTASNWAANLSYGGHDDWRLANADVNGDGTIESAGALTDNEPRYLHYVHNVNTNYSGLFTNMPVGSGAFFAMYWSSTAVAHPISQVWSLSFSSGIQFGQTVSGNAYAWAVADGDIAASIVPIPAAVWLFGSALGLLGWMRRKP